MRRGKTRTLGVIASSASINMLALAVVVGFATFIAISVAYKESVIAGVAVAGAGAVLVGVSLLLSVYQGGTREDIQRLLLLQTPTEPFFVAGYLWGEYGLVLGGLLGSLAAFIRRRKQSRKHDA
jgi:hypothetical protein